MSMSFPRRHMLAPPPAPKNNNLCWKDIASNPTVASARSFSLLTAKRRPMRGLAPLPHTPRPSSAGPAEHVRAVAAGENGLAAHTLPSAGELQTFLVPVPPPKPRSSSGRPFRNSRSLKETPSRWSGSKALYTELVHAVNGTSIESLLTTVVQAQALGASHWPELSTAQARLKVLQSAERRVQLAADSVDPSEIEGTLKECRLLHVDKEWPLCVTLGKRLQSLIELKHELQQAACGLVIDRLISALRGAGDFGVKGWHEVMLAESRLEYLQSLIASLYDATNRASVEALAAVVKEAKDLNVTEETEGSLGAAFKVAHDYLARLLRDEHRADARDKRPPDDKTGVKDKEVESEMTSLEFQLSTLQDTTLSAVLDLKNLAEGSDVLPLRVAVVSAASSAAMYESSEVLQIQWPALLHACERLAVLTALEVELREAAHWAISDDLVAAIARADALDCGEWELRHKAARRLEQVRSVEAELLEAFAAGSINDIAETSKRASAAGLHAMPLVQGAETLLGAVQKAGGELPHNAMRQLLGGLAEQLRQMSQVRHKMVHVGVVIEDAASACALDEEAPFSNLLLGIINFAGTNPQVIRVIPVGPGKTVVELLVPCPHAASPDSLQQLREYFKKLQHDPKYSDRSSRFYSGKVYLLHSHIMESCVCLESSLEVVEPASACAAALQQVRAKLIKDDTAVALPAHEDITVSWMGDSPISMLSVCGLTSASSISSVVYGALEQAYGCLRPALDEEAPMHHDAPRLHSVASSVGHSTGVTAASPCSSTPQSAAAFEDSLEAPSAAFHIGLPGMQVQTHQFLPLSTEPAELQESAELAPLSPSGICAANGRTQYSALTENMSVTTLADCARNFEVAGLASHHMDHHTTSGLEVIDVASPSQATGVHAGSLIRDLFCDTMEQSPGTSHVLNAAQMDPAAIDKDALCLSAAVGSVAHMEWSAQNLVQVPEHTRSSITLLETEGSCTMLPSMQQPSQNKREGCRAAQTSRHLEGSRPEGDVLSKSALLEMGNESGAADLVVDSKSTVLSDVQRVVDSHANQIACQTDCCTVCTEQCSSIPSCRVVEESMLAYSHVPINSYEEPSVCTTFVETLPTSTLGLNDLLITACTGNAPLGVSQWSPTAAVLQHAGRASDTATHVEDEQQDANAKVPANHLWSTESLHEQLAKSQVLSACSDDGATHKIDASKVSDTVESFGCGGSLVLRCMQDAVDIQSQTKCSACTEVNESESATGFEEAEFCTVDCAPHKMDIHYQTQFSVEGTDEKVNDDATLTDMGQQDADISVTRNFCGDLSGYREDAEQRNTASSFSDAGKSSAHGGTLVSGLVVDVLHSKSEAEGSSACNDQCSESASMLTEVKVNMAFPSSPASSFTQSLKAHSSSSRTSDIHLRDIMVNAQMSPQVPVLNHAERTSDIATIIEEEHSDADDRKIATDFVGFAACHEGVPPRSDVPSFSEAGESLANGQSLVSKLVQHAIHIHPQTEDSIACTEQCSRSASMFAASNADITFPRVRSNSSAQRVNAQSTASDIADDSESDQNNAGDLTTIRKSPQDFAAFASKTSEAGESLEGGESFVSKLVRDVVDIEFHTEGSLAYTDHCSRSTSILTAQSLETQTPSSRANAPLPKDIVESSRLRPRGATFKRADRVSDIVTVIEESRSDAGQSSARGDSVAHKILQDAVDIHSQTQVSMACTDQCTESNSIIPGVQANMASLALGCCSSSPRATAQAPKEVVLSSQLPPRKYANLISDAGDSSISGHSFVLELVQHAAETHRKTDSETVCTNQYSQPTSVEGEGATPKREASVSRAGQSSTCGQSLVLKLVQDDVDRHVPIEGDKLCTNECSCSASNSAGFKPSSKNRFYNTATGPTDPSPHGDPLVLEVLQDALSPNRISKGARECCPPEDPLVLRVLQNAMDIHQTEGDIVCMDQLSQSASIVVGMTADVMIPRTSTQGFLDAATGPAMQQPVRSVGLPLGDRRCHIEQDVLEQSFTSTLDGRSGLYAVARHVVNDPIHDILTRDEPSSSGNPNCFKATCVGVKGEEGPCSRSRFLEDRQESPPCPISSPTLEHARVLQSPVSEVEVTSLSSASDLTTECVLKMMMKRAVGAAQGRISPALQSISPDVIVPAFRKSPKTGNCRVIPGSALSNSCSAVEAASEVDGMSLLMDQILYGGQEPAVQISQAATEHSQVGLFSSTGASEAEHVTSNAGSDVSVGTLLDIVFNGDAKTCQHAKFSATSPGPLLPKRPRETDPSEHNSTLDVPADALIDAILTPKNTPECTAPPNTTVQDLKQRTSFSQPSPTNKAMIFAQYPGQEASSSVGAGSGSVTEAQIDSIVTRILQRGDIWNVTEQHTRGEANRMQDGESHSLTPDGQSPIAKSGCTISALPHVNEPICDLLHNQSPTFASVPRNSGHCSGCVSEASPRHMRDESVAGVSQAESGQVAAMISHQTLTKIADGLESALATPSAHASDNIREERGQKRVVEEIPLTGGSLSDMPGHTSQALNNSVVEESVVTTRSEEEGAAKVASSAVGEVLVKASNDSRVNSGTVAANGDTVPKDRSAGVSKDSHTKAGAGVEDHDAVPGDRSAGQTRQFVASPPLGKTGNYPALSPEEPPARSNSADEESRPSSAALPGARRSRCCFC